VCTATSRIYVQDTVYEKYLEAFKKHTKDNTSIGSQFDSATSHGPQVSKAAKEKILGYIETGKAEGADLIYGGTQSGIPDKGWFIEPTVFANVKNDMKIVKEEVFGPFVVIQSFSTEEEAVEKANDSEFGLGAAVFTKDIMRGHRVAGAIEAGMVWVCLSCMTSIGDVTDYLTDQQLTRLAFWRTIWWMQAKWYRTRAWTVCIGIVYPSQSCACKSGHLFVVEKA
jgi:acyl-CoA reductase-like NAD-dependent aldehyde dehydrogenase